RESGQSLEHAQVALRRLRHDGIGQVRRRWLLVPLAATRQLLEAVAHGLLVERWLSASDLERFLRPEARRVRCQYLVDQYERAIRQRAELALGVGEEDAGVRGDVAPTLVDREAPLLQLPGELRADSIAHLR